MQFLIEDISSGENYFCEAPSKLEAFNRTIVKLIEEGTELDTLCSNLDIKITLTEDLPQI